MTAAEATAAGPSLKPALEAVLMIADQPLDAITLAQAVEYPRGDVEVALEELSAEYTEAQRGFDLRRVGVGWRFYSREDYAAVVERFVVDGQSARLTSAALETLAVVAYRQPISRARVSAVRGVNVDAVVRTLTSRGLVEECGTDPHTGAHLYGTTVYFLERMGLTSLDELPDIAPFLPEMGDLDDETDLVDTVAEVAREFEMPLTPPEPPAGVSEAPVADRDG
jgi:segregation and condensation protein B